MPGSIISSYMKRKGRKGKKGKGKWEGDGVDGCESGRMTGYGGDLEGGSSNEQSVHRSSSRESQWCM